MTKETMDVCTGEMDEAIASGDQLRIWRANARFNRAMMDCQCKTASRVKWLVKAVWGLIASVVILSFGGDEVIARIFKAVIGG